MSRARLSPEEAEARRAARVRASFQEDHYAHYDPRLPRGNRHRWSAAAEAAIDALTGGRRETPDLDPALSRRYRRELELLGLATMPTMEGLKSAFRKAMMAAHPDHGGPEVKGADGKYATQHVQEAFERLVSLYPRT